MSKVITANHNLLKVRKGGKNYLRKKYVKLGKTQPDPDCVSLSARSALAVYGIR
jgi:hypothetical protein